MIDKTKQYRARDGREVRIYATDGFPNAIHGAIKNTYGWEIYWWDGDGKHRNAECCDLIEVKPRIKRTVWLNVYREGVLANCSEEMAASFCSKDRLACVKVEIDCEEGHGL